MKAIRLRTNHMVNPVGIDRDRLFLSWNCRGDISESAWQVVLRAGETTLWDSGKVEGDAMHVSVPVEVPAKTEVLWKVKLWNENGEEGGFSEEASFETGLDHSGISVTWVNPELERSADDPVRFDDAINSFARENVMRKAAEAAAKAAEEGKEQPGAPVYVPHQPASYVRKYFEVAKTGKARLYITAKGLYVAWINNRRAGDMVLAPGSFTGSRHLGVQTIDVTDLIHEGSNEFVAALGDGWHRSTTGVDGDRDLFGEDLGLWFLLEVDGEPVACADETMEASQNGPIRQNDMQQGEVYDARLEEITGWHGVTTSENTLELCGMNTVAIREHEQFPGRVFTTPKGETVVDFGQNIAGYPAIKITAHEGQKIRLICGEALDENGNFTQENFQDRARHKEGGTLQCVELTCKEGINEFKPSFTIMGFQYAKVETDIDLEGAGFTAFAVYSDMEPLGEFRCSDPDVEKLVQNSIWSMKGNFCDVPTDCPTRERAGWTGDMGVFIDTGLYFMNCSPVVRKWLKECRLNQYPDGRMANIAPPNGKGGFMTAMLCMSSGWGDASIIVPYSIYKREGDKGILLENYDMMKKWYAFLLGRARATKPEQQEGPYASYTVLNGLDYGEWCEPGMTPQQSMMNPRKTVGTAYLAYSGRLLSEIAEILGEEEDAAAYREISENAKKAFHFAFTDNGRIDSTRQCEYVRAIRFGLLSEGEAEEAAATLNRMVIENGYHLNTGFLSTPFLPMVLTDYGYTDTAYRLLLEDTAPGWLYEVKKGANTVWETWTGIDETGKPSESLNHYSYGAVCGWLFGDVAGIRYSEGEEGRKLVIKPAPDPSLGWVKASYLAPCGLITSGWKYTPDKNTIVYEVEVPANQKAVLILPDGSKYDLKSGLHKMERPAC